MNDNRVVALRGEVLPTEPVPDVVETLERLLAEAKAGHIRGIAYAVATTLAGEGTGTGWDMAGGQKHVMAAAVMMLHHRFAEALQSLSVPRAP